MTKENSKNPPLPSPPEPPPKRMIKEDGPNPFKGHDPHERGRG